MSPQRALLAALLLFQLLAFGGHQGMTKIFYKLPDTGQPPILISLAETAKLDLQDAPANPSFLFNYTEHNNSQVYVKTESTQNEVEENKSTTSDDSRKAETEPINDQPLVFKAKSVQDVRQNHEEAVAMPSNKAQSTEREDNDRKEDVFENGTGSEKTPVKTAEPHEDIPSFSEWAQKQLAEAEKQDTVLNHSSQPSHTNTNINSKSTKLSTKNYASPACGAKIVAVNSEAGSASSILSPNRDEYMLNTCNSRIWFVIELCEAVQAQNIELANFELFSSSPKDFAVYFSDRFPTREWTSVGQFTAKDERDIQTFDLYPHLFGKFIKVEMLSHYGSEHYCPISSFKVYGTSEFEVLEKESAQHIAPIEEEDDEILGDLPDARATEADISKNLFGSARDAVMSIMKKAAEVLVKSEVPKNSTAKENDTTSINQYEQCCTPSHIIVCDNCSNALYSDVFDLISCSTGNLKDLVNQHFIHETLKNTAICLPFGLDFKNKRTVSFRNERAKYMTTVFSQNYIAALCNMLAIIDKKVVLNTSHDTEDNVTSNLTLDKISNINVEEKNLDQVVQVPFKDKLPSDSDKIKVTKTDKPKVSDPKPILPELPIVGSKDSMKNIPTENEKENSDNNHSATVEPEQTLVKENSSEKKGKHDKTTSEKIDLEANSDNKINKDSLKVDQVETSNSGKPDASQDMKLEPTSIGEKTLTTNSGNVGGEDINDQLILENESYMSEFDQLGVDPVPPGSQASSPNAQINQGQSPQKESVFLRLSNRVKVLERNMSLSGQYLEELSRRYKKQVEEMQKTFDKTILQVTDERKKSEEREQKNLEQLSLLQEQLIQLNSAMDLLMEERNSWFGNITFFKFVVLQVIIVLIAFYCLSRRQTTDFVPAPITKKSTRRKNNEKCKLRRKSVEGVSGHVTPANKKRRPSEEALHIARLSAEELDLDVEDGEWQVARRNRRRKTSILHRPLPSTEGSNIPEWERQDSICALQENVIPLDEEEFIAPVPEPTEFVKIGGPKKPNVPLKKEFPKTNGSIISNIRGATKSVKSRRLSSPAFFRTALSRQSSRSTSGPVVQKQSAATLFEGKPDMPGKKGATSESPSGRVSPSSMGEFSIQENGLCDVSETSSVKQSKKRSFKNMFKKVF